MSRYYKCFPLSMSEEQANTVIQSFLQMNGFEPYFSKGEACYKKGQGILTGPQLMKITVENGLVTIEAWIKMALLPGVYCGEMGTEGFYGIALKKALKSKVDTLEVALGFVPGVTPFSSASWQPAPAAVQAPAQSSQTKTAVCPSCGAGVEPDGRFCKACGGTLEASNQSGQ